MPLSLVSRPRHTGGCVNITEEGLMSNYETYCDPRLNYGQSIEAALCMSNALGRR